MTAKRLTHHTRGLVLRWVPYSNTSQVVTVFTRDQGVVSFLAKGSLRASRRSSAFPAPFDVTGWYDLVYRERAGELDLAIEARLVEGFDHLRRALPIYLEACFALEVMLRMFRPRDPHPAFLRGALSFLKLLGVGQGRTALRIHFVSALLGECGLSPVWGSCAECDRAPVGEPFLRLPVGAVCAGCRDSRDARIRPEVTRFLASERRLAWGHIPGAAPSGPLLGETWAALVPVLLYHLEAKPRSLRFLRA